MPRTCPDCGSDLRAEDILGITLDVCPECAGIWFDDGELLKLKELGDEAIDVVEGETAPTQEGEPKKSTRMCPDCGTALDEYSYLYTTKVELDACPNCNGTWVQEGELGAMRTALEAARSTPENEHMMRTLDHQLKLIEAEQRHRETLERHHLITRVLRVLAMRRPYVS